MVGRKSEKIKTQPKTQFFPNFNGRDNKLKLNQVVIFPVDHIKKRVNKIRIYAFLVNFLNCFALILRLFPFFFLHGKRLLWYKDVWWFPCSNTSMTWALF